MSIDMSTLTATTARTVIIALITMGAIFMSTSCADNDSGDAHHRTDTPRLPTCAQIAEALRDLVAHLDPVNLVLTSEDIENQSWCAWEDKPTGKLIHITARYGDIAVQDIRDKRGHWDPSSYARPEYFLAEPVGSGAEDSIFVINNGSAEVYAPGCEVNLTYFTPNFSMKFIGEEYVIGQAMQATLQVAKLMKQ